MNTETTDLNTLLIQRADKELVERIDRAMESTVRLADHLYADKIVITPENAKSWDVTIDGQVLKGELAISGRLFLRLLKVAIIKAETAANREQAAREFLKKFDELQASFDELRGQS